MGSSLPPRPLPDLAAPPSPSGLADQLRAATRELHTHAERSGILAMLLRGGASRAGYALLLRSLLPAYEALESGLERKRRSPAIGPLANPAVYRSASLAADLASLWGPDWEQGLPLLASAKRYQARIREAATGNGERLVAHAYVRFLGDLNGGRVLARRLPESLALTPDALHFYAYPELADAASFAGRYREQIDERAGQVDAEVVAEEARLAFGFNIDVSVEVESYASLEATPWGARRA